jgi:DNA-binding protein HU-beta
MKKQTMIRKVARLTGVEEAQVRRVLTHYVEQVMHTVAKGERVDWRGFGSFEPVLRKAKKGNSGGPGFGKPMVIPARVQPRFVASPAFAALVLDPTKIPAEVPTKVAVAPANEAPIGAAPHTTTPFF